MYNFLFGWLNSDTRPEEALLDESDDLDNLMLDSTSNTVKYKMDLSNYVLKENIICKIRLKIRYVDGSCEYRNYIGKYYENKEIGKYYVRSAVNLRPKNETGKMTYRIEIYVNEKLDHEGVLSFRYKMNDSITNTFETLSVSYDKKHELIISVIRESNKYVMDNLKYIGIIKS